MPQRIKAGKLGEEIAKKFLQKRGYKIISQNFHSRHGEIDLVAIDGDTLVFVEVKTRWSEKFGLPEEAVTQWKLRSIIKAGEYFKLMHPRTPDLVRIDVVAIDMEGRTIKEIRLFKNAGF